MHFKKLDARVRTSNEPYISMSSISEYILVSYQVKIYRQRQNIHKKYENLELLQKNEQHLNIMNNFNSIPAHELLLRVISSFLGG